MSQLSAKTDKAKERLQDMVASMSPRDRMIYAGIGLLTLLGFLGFTSFTMYSALAAQNSQLSDLRYDLKIISELQEEYNDLQKNSNQIKAQLQKHANTELSAFLEKSASKQEIRDKLTKVKKTATGPKGGIVSENIYQVRLKDLTLSQLSNFIHDIETTGYPLQIQNLKVRSRKRSDETTLSVDIDIAAFKLTEETEEPKEEK